MELLGLGTIKIGTRNLEPDTEEEEVEEIVIEDSDNEEKDVENRNTVPGRGVTDGPPSSPSHSGGITSSEDERLADFHMEEDEESGGREGGGHCKWMY